MGQKTNPIAFRLGITQKHLSNWYAKKTNYSFFLETDFKIRNQIEKSFQDFLILSDIKITRGGSYNNIQSSGTILIKALHPNVYEISKKALTTFFETTKKKQLLNVLQKKYLMSKNFTKIGKFNNLLFYFIAIKARQILRALNNKFKQNFKLKFQFCTNLFTDANLIAKSIGEQIKKRIPFRRVLKQTLKKAQLANLKGIKIELSGRLNGIDIARSEWKREGTIPLHTLNIKIDYSTYFVNTIYGIIGIKVWVYKK